MNVPFLDLKAQYSTIKGEIDAGITSVLEACAFAGGPFVEAFEQGFAGFCGCQHAVGVGNGTAALWLALRAWGIGAGDEVITVPNTFIATAEAISLTGARPVFVDIDERTYTMDIAKIEDALTRRTKAIVPVHIFGQAADMDPIASLARRHGLLLLEDACQAHGAGYKGRRAGSLGDAAAFSFYPGKNLGAYGEAGAVTTDSRDLGDAVRVLRDHGQSAKYFHETVGWNARMDGIQGAVLTAKLLHLESWNDARRVRAARYAALLGGESGITLPFEARYARHVYHVFAVRVKNRDQVLGLMRDRGVSCGIHYPVPVHLQKAYKHLGYDAGAFPVAEKCAGEFLSLPMYPELTDEMLEYVCGSLVEAVRRCP